MHTQPQRSDHRSPSLSRSSPELDASILKPEYQADSVDAWNEKVLRRRAALSEAETRVDKLPAYQGPCSERGGSLVSWQGPSYERGDRIMSLAVIELSLARSMARRLTAAAYHEPGLLLDLVKGEWLTARRPRRPLQPRCCTFGCTLPDLHAGLHQVANQSSPCPIPTPPPQTASPSARPSRRWLARCASVGWYPGAGLVKWTCGVRR